MFWKKHDFYEYVFLSIFLLIRNWNILVERGLFRCYRHSSPSFMKLHLTNWKRVSWRRRPVVIKLPSPHTQRKTRTRCSQMRNAPNTRKGIKTLTAGGDIQDIIKVDSSRVTKVKGQGRIHILHLHRVINTITISRVITGVEEGEGDIITPECTTWDIPHPWDRTITLCTWGCTLPPDILCPLWWSYREGRDLEVTLEVIIQDMVQDITNSARYQVSEYYLLNQISRIWISLTWLDISVYCLICLTRWLILRLLTGISFSTCISPTQPDICNYINQWSSWILNNTAQLIFKKKFVHILHCGIFLKNHV